MPRHGRPPKNTPPPPLPICYHAEFGHSALKGVGTNTGEPPKFGSAGILLSWDGKRGCIVRQYTIHVPPHGLPRQIWWFCDKGCTYK